MTFLPLKQRVVTALGVGGYAVHGGGIPDISGVKWVKFANPNSYLTLGGLSNAFAVGYRGVFSFWIDFNAADGVDQHILGFERDVDNTSYVRFRRNASNEITLSMPHSTGPTPAAKADFIHSDDLSGEADNQLLVANGVTHVYLMFDTTASAGNRLKLYLNGVEAASVNMTDNTKHYSHWDVQNGFLGASDSADGNFRALSSNARLGEFWMDWGNASYTIPPLADFYVDGVAQDLGSDGSTPTGNQPALYCAVHDGEGPDDFATNKGYGGAATKVGSILSA